MITCKICHKFVKNIVSTYNKFTATILKVEGDCKKHGRVEVNYDDSEELGIEDF
jgi:hypothetical protein